MIEIRRFRNTDPPALAAVWNDSQCHRGGFAIHSANLFEHGVFSKPYFDPKGLLIAEESGQAAGFIHVGFGPNAAENDISTASALICALAVRTGFRRRGVGAKLLQHAEQYARDMGSKELVAGAMRPMNPFYFGLYGGADSPGFLCSDPTVRPFFERHGFTAQATTFVFELDLASFQPVVDPRFLNLRRRYDVQLHPQPELASWWQECVFGQIEPAEFRLIDKLNGIPVARLLAWEMSSVRQPAPAAAGLLDLNVRPDVRRQGLARFLLSQMIRYIQEQYFRTIEVHASDQNPGAIALFQGLGFKHVDTGISYQRPIAAQ